MLRAQQVRGQRAGQRQGRRSDLLCLASCAVIAFNKESAIVGVVIILLDRLRGDDTRTCGAREEEEALAGDHPKEDEIGVIGGDQICWKKRLSSEEPSDIGAVDDSQVDNLIEDLEQKEGGVCEGPEGSGSVG
jgi:hypothetical protein